MTEKITSQQENRIADLVREVVRTLGFSKEEAQEVIESGGMLQAEVKETLKKLVIANKCFGPAIKEFEITVPADYDHDTQIDTFAKKAKKLSTTYYYNDEITSANFSKATNRLTPGKAYRVKIFPILSRASSEDCLSFLWNQNALFVGAQGMTLVADLKGDELPAGKYTVSFDEKETLWKEFSGGRRVPGVIRYSDGGFRFYLGYFRDSWDGSDCLLCFCDLDAQALRPCA